MQLVGQWTGTNRLWLSPAEKPKESGSTATISPMARRKFLRIDYTWAIEGETQEGSILFGHEKKRSLVTAIWVDSWHMGEKAMVCQGEVGKDGVITVRGSYDVASGPNWGWWTEIEIASRDAFRLRMFNVPPDGRRERAVEATFRRSA